MRQLKAVILAAGEGKRMCSRHAKVLQTVCGRPMIEWVLQAAKEAGAAESIAVVGNHQEEIKDCLQDRVRYAVQEQPFGGAHAVLQVKALLEEEDTLLVLAGDLPMVTGETLREGYARHMQAQADATVLTAEESDDSDGIYFFQCSALKSVLEQRELSEVSDLFDALSQNGGNTACCKAENGIELMDVNNRVQLAEAERQMCLRTIAQLQAAGVTVADPGQTYVEPGVQVGMDTVLLPGCRLSGTTVIGEDCVIGPNTSLSNMQVGCGVTMKYTVGMDSVVGNSTTVGPFAYIRPNSVIGERVKIGDFVEIKNSNIDCGTKVSHLTYIGDSDVGSGVNFGCGTVTVNYDGTHKYRTAIGDKAFIGCNTNLVAPVTVAPEAFIAAGSTITEDIPDDCLAIARARQTNIKGWVSKRKEKNSK